MITGKQKGALEKITGKPWDSWNSEAVSAYFSFTDRGIRSTLFNKVWQSQPIGFSFNEAEQSLWDLMQYHTFHPVTVEMWKEDFRNSLLFLSDFDNSPDAYKKHAKEIYDSVVSC